MFRLVIIADIVSDSNVCRTKRSFEGTVCIDSVFHLLLSMTRQTKMPSDAEKSATPPYFAAVFKMLSTPMPSRSLFLGRPFSNRIFWTQEFLHTMIILLSFCRMKIAIPGVLQHIGQDGHQIIIGNTPCFLRPVWSDCALYGKALRVQRSCLRVSKQGV